MHAQLWRQQGPGLHRRDKNEQRRPNFPESLKKALHSLSFATADIALQLHWFLKRQVFTRLSILNSWTAVTPRHCLHDDSPTSSTLTSVAGVSMARSPTKRLRLTDVIHWSQLWLTDVIHWSRLSVLSLIKSNTSTGAAIAQTNQCYGNDWSWSPFKSNFEKKNSSVVQPQVTTLCLLCKKFEKKASNVNIWLGWMWMHKKHITVARSQLCETGSSMEENWGSY